VTVLRSATESDVSVMRDVERAAGEAFRSLGMDAVADDDPPPAVVLREYVASGRAWVVDEGHGPAGYLLADVVDGCAHVEQVTVHPEHAGARWGARLVDHLAERALRRGLPALTLTTFRDVPWNGPYYLRLGFRWLPEEELTPGLRALRQREREHGLDRWPRGCMRREVSPLGAGAPRETEDASTPGARGR